MSARWFHRLTLVASVSFGGVAAAAEAETHENETVISAPAPLHGSRVPRDRVAANVQTVTADALAESQALDLSSYLDERAGSVSLNQVQGNPLQPDLEYRGFVSSPLLGTPQGLSVYLDGVRLNEPFGDTVNWDLIPTGAIRSVNLMPGSNPLFGPNTLGGALSIETKTGFSDPGAAAQLSGGSYLRRQASFQGGTHGEHLAIFAAGQSFAERGWRQNSPSRTLSGFLAGTYADAASLLNLSVLAADTTLTGNGPAPAQLLEHERTAVFTSPDRTLNRRLMAILRGERTLAQGLRLTGVGFYRLGRTRTANGDQRAWAACTAPGQTSWLCTSEEGGAEGPVTDGTGNPVPFDPSYDAANNTTATRQRQGGLSAQLAMDRPLGARENHLVFGAVADDARISFSSQSTVAQLQQPSRGTVDTGIVDDTSRVDVNAVVRNLGVYVSDIVGLRSDLFLTLSGRFNLSSLSLEDQRGDDLSGDHHFRRFNPAVGISYQPRPAVGVYGSYSESARAPTPVELTCADPTAPCRLPNGFVSDPPLAQVVARTVEAGARGRWQRDRTTLEYAAAVFSTVNSDDILFVNAGSIANQGYFANVGDTRRRGVETSLRARRVLGGGAGRIEAVARYTFLDATFRTSFLAPSALHPDAVNGAIAVPAGARLPSLPAHLAKLDLAWVSGFGLSCGADIIANGSQVLRGDEANRLAPLPGYAIVNLRASYRLAPPVAVFARADNLLDTSYATFGVLGNAAEVLGDGYGSRRFIGPGAPRAAWLGVDVRY